MIIMTQKNQQQQQRALHLTCIRLRLLIGIINKHSRPASNHRLYISRSVGKVLWESLVQNTEVQSLVMQNVSYLGEIWSDTACSIAELCGNSGGLSVEHIKEFLSRCTEGVYLGKDATYLECLINMQRHIEQIWGVPEQLSREAQKLALKIPQIFVQNATWSMLPIEEAKTEAYLATRIVEFFGNVWILSSPSSSSLQISRTLLSSLSSLSYLSLPTWGNHCDSQEQMQKNKDIILSQIVKIGLRILLETGDLDAHQVVLETWSSVFITAGSSRAAMLKTRYIKEENEDSIETPAVLPSTSSSKILDRLLETTTNARTQEEFHALNRNSILERNEKSNLLPRYFRSEDAHKIGAKRGELPGTSADDNVYPAIQQLQQKQHQGDYTIISEKEKFAKTQQTHGLAIIVATMTLMGKNLVTQQRHEKIPIILRRLIDICGLDIFLDWMEDAVEIVHKSLGKMLESFENGPNQRVRREFVEGLRNFGKENSLILFQKMFISKVHQYCKLYRSALAERKRINKDFINSE